MKKLLLFAIVVLGFSAASFGQANVTETATASATIITPLTLTAGDDLAFGNIAIHATNSGTVTVSPAGDVSNDGGTTIPAIAGTQSAASFTITGEAGSLITITLPGDDDVTISDGTNTMKVVDFEKSNITALDASGDGEFTVGATLEVAGGQVAGDYEGSFDVIVIYN